MILELFLYIFWIIIAFFLIELLLHTISSFVNKKFQWYITNRDELPKLPKAGLEKFIPKGFDPELGWIRKPNTSNTEMGKLGQTSWTINSYGARTNPNLENSESRISCYGDSFTFCRQVNDDETWEHYLSEFQHTNVQNFGVGNYGIDQALLRLKRQYSKNKTDVVILAVVPDTISRILSVWKHYSEYGNTFGFKPRFMLEGNLKLIKNLIDHETKFSNYEKYLNEIRKNDFFYKNKFKKDKIHFPYIWTILKNLKRNFPIIFWVLRIEIMKKNKATISKIEWNPMKIIMKINLKWEVNLFKNSPVTELLRKIIEDYVSYSKVNKFKPVFVFLPQKNELLYVKHFDFYYQDFIKTLDSIDGLYQIDVTKKLLEISDLDNLYSDDNEYGGHYSKEGNKKIASIINYEFKNLGLSQN